MGNNITSLTCHQVRFLLTITPNYKGILHTKAVFFQTKCDHNDICFVNLCSYLTIKNASFPFEKGKFMSTYGSLETIFSNHLWNFQSCDKLLVYLIRRKSNQKVSHKKKYTIFLTSHVRYTTKIYSSFLQHPINEYQIAYVHQQMRLRRMSLSQS